MPPPAEYPASQARAKQLTADRGREQQAQTDARPTRRRADYPAAWPKQAAMSSGRKGTDWACTRMKSEMASPAVKRLRRLIAGIGCLSLLAACGTIPRQSGLEIAAPKALDEVLDDYVRTGAYPFLYARLEDKDGRVIYEHSAVNPGLTPGGSIDGRSWMRIWSMSKIVTISVVLDLVEDGVLNLNDPVTKYIPEFAQLQVAGAPDGTSLADLSAASYRAGADPGATKDLPCPLPIVPMTRPMTLLDLLNHEAGFYYATTNIPCLDRLVAAQDLPSARNSQDLIDRMATLPLIQQPGTTYFYGTSITVLGVVAERATGRSLKQLVETRVTRPLRIQGLQYGLPAAATLPPRISGKDGQLRVAKDGELDIFGPSVPDYDPAHALYLGGEGMIATADGYADFLRMLLNRGTLNGSRVLEESSIEDLTAPHTQLDSEYGRNGYNLWINNGRLSDGSQGRGGLWIGGGYEGTHFWIDPEFGFVGLIMSQIYWVPKSGQDRDDRFREAVYDQLVVDGRRFR